MRLSRTLAVLCFGCALTGIVSAAEDTGMMQQPQKPDAVVMDSVQATFTVKAVDQASRTVTLQGADVFGPERWQPVAGSARMFATPLERDPGQVFVDGKPLYMKVAKLAADKRQCDHGTCIHLHQSMGG